MRMGAMAVATILCFSVGANAAELEFKSSTNGGACDSCAWTSAQGEITLNSYKKLQAYAKEHGVNDIYLNSEGGSTAGAILLGKTIRELGASTHIGQTLPEADNEVSQDPKPGRCTDACALAFLGGSKRSVDDASRLGHLSFDSPPPRRFKGKNASAGANASSTEILKYVLDMGVDPRALLSEAGSKAAFTAEELASLKLVWSPSLLSQWRVEPFKHGVVAISEGTDGDPSLTLYCENGHRTLLYSLRKPSDTLVIGYEENLPYEFAGTEIPVDKIDFKPTETLWRAYFTLPDDFMPIVKGDEDSLNNTSTDILGRGTSITFKTRGLVEAARIAFMNCI